MRYGILLCAPLLAIYMPTCAPPVHSTVSPAEAEKTLASLWRDTNITSADLFNGPWGAEFAPDPHATYAFVKPKTHGDSAGLTARDPHGTEWSVKQGDEGHVEVTVSRVLSALGYHQPPVYFLPAYALDRGTWVEHAPGGRFRPKVKGLKDEGIWSWQENPFVGTQPYQGLLVVLMMFNSSDLKNTNNTYYKLSEAREGAKEWFVVRDIGTALGETARLAPRRNEPAIFAEHAFIEGVANGFVRFSYHGWHQEIVRDRITVDDVHWACRRLASLSDGQWADAFRAGGFEADVARRYIERLKQKIEEGLRL
jgi:hypothetical protein